MKHNLYYTVIYILSHYGTDPDKRTQEVKFQVPFAEAQPSAVAVLCTVLKIKASVKSPIKTALLLKSATINLTVTYNTAVHPYLGGDR